VAGVQWERSGAATTFYTGAAFSVLAAVPIVGRGRRLGETA